MKKLVLFVALLLAFSIVAEAQVSPIPLKIWTAKTYAVNQSDTSKAFYVAASGLASLWLKYDDSVNVITLIQYSKDEGATYSFIMGDTLNHTGGGAVTGSTYREVLLRGASTDKFGGVAGLVRVVQNFQATLCGVTSPRYRAWFMYRP